MKIIRTPLGWDSQTGETWLESTDYSGVGTADITVKELVDGFDRTGTVTFRQSESNNTEDVTVIQNRRTFYYTLKTNRPGAKFSIGGTSVTSDENGIATRVVEPDEDAPTAMTATPITTIAEFKVNKSSINFPASASSSTVTFTWIDWDKDEVSLPRWYDETPKGVINSKTTHPGVVDSVSVTPSNSSWLSASTNGTISVSANPSYENRRTGTVEFEYSGKSQTVTVTQKKRDRVYEFFGVKTTSSLADGQQVTFKVNGTNKPPVPFSANTSAGPYVAYVEALEGSSVLASCEISDSMITASVTSLSFAKTGETKHAQIYPIVSSLTASNVTLNGSQELDYDNFYEIEQTTGGCDVVATSNNQDFVIQMNNTTKWASITVGPNETSAKRTGEATFSIQGDPTKFTKISLEQEHINWFSFKSTVIGAPNSGSVTFYASSNPAGSAITTVAYQDTRPGVREASWSASIDTGVVSFRVDGFEDSASVSPSTSSVTFDSIGMELRDGKYHISGADAEVTVTAQGVSYDYKIGDSTVTAPTGIILPNREVVLNATATTTNQLSVSPKNMGVAWGYVVTTGDPYQIAVKYLALRDPSDNVKTMTLEYKLKWPDGSAGGPSATAQTKFTVLAGASSIVLSGLALSSDTVFRQAFSDNHWNIPSGGNDAFVFAFIPPTTTQMTSVKDMQRDYCKRAALRFKPARYGTGQWMLFYPETTSDVPDAPYVSKDYFPQFVAKVYAISFWGGLWPYGSGKQDAWTLGPLVYRNPITGNYYEVDGFQILSSGTKVTMYDTSKNYPTLCKFSPSLSSTSEYFGFNTGAHSLALSATGTISDDGRKWTITGSAQGGLSTGATTNFFNRLKPMRERNYSFRYYGGASNCTGSSYSSPAAMAHAFSGNINTNMLGSVGIQAIYYGKYGNQDPDVKPTSATYSVPADSYVVSPTTPGDTSSVVYDAETDNYIIYNIDNVVVLDKTNNYAVVDVSELMPTSGEIIGPVDP